VGGLHRFTYPLKHVVQGPQIYFLAQAFTIGRKYTGSIVVPAVEELVYEGLSTTPQRVEQRRDSEGERA